MFSDPRTSGKARGRLLLNKVWGGQLTRDLQELICGVPLVDTDALQIDCNFQVCNYDRLRILYFVYRRHTAPICEDSDIGVHPARWFRVLKWLLRIAPNRDQIPTEVLFCTYLANGQPLETFYSGTRISVKNCLKESRKHLSASLIWLNTESPSPRAHSRNVFAEVQSSMRRMLSKIFSETLWFNTTFSAGMLHLRPLSGLRFGVPAAQPQRMILRTKPRKPKSRSRSLS